MTKNKTITQNPWEGLDTKVLDYYQKNGRSLPWREDPTPYHVWISEIMLQQTRVDTVIPYFNRFMAQYPTITELAQAEEESLLKLWEGLGYYSRIRNIHKAAQALVDNYQGALPQTKKQLLQLPGIGDYTAGAIASIAFGQKETAIDGNLIRIGSRLIAYGDTTKNAAGKKAMEDLWQQLLPDQQPGDFNQAMMDIGATICLPNREPLCSKCPLASYCSAYANGNPMDYPYKDQKAAKKHQDWTLFILLKDNQVLLEKRPSKGLLASMLQFPMAEGNLDEDQALQWLRKHHHPPLRLKKGPASKHIFTHIQWQMSSWIVELDPFVVMEKNENQPNNQQWESIHAMDHITLPTAYRDFRQAVRELADTQI